MPNCKNYHSLSSEQILTALERIRWWLFDNRDHPQFQKAHFAFTVALNALFVQKELTQDGWVEYRMLVDNLCNSLDND